MLSANQSDGDYETYPFLEPPPRHDMTQYDSETPEGDAPQRKVGIDSCQHEHCSNCLLQRLREDESDTRRDVSAQKQVPEAPHCLQNDSCTCLLSSRFPVVLVQQYAESTKQSKAQAIQGLGPADVYAKVVTFPEATESPRVSLPGFLNCETNAVNRRWTTASTRRSRTWGR